MATRPDSRTRKPRGQRPASRKPALGAAYLALLKASPLRPIRSEQELNQAIEILDRLQGRTDPLLPEEQDYLDCMSCLIERYEAEAYPMPAVSGPAMIRHLMEVHSENLSQLAAATGIVVSTLSSILSGKRRLTLDHIKALASHFGVEPAVFLD